MPKQNKSSINQFNYRPGKIYERIIQSRLNLFISDNNVIKDRQHGFRKNKGTHTATATTYETIANALANKQQVYVVLRDVAKAFDKVWHNGLE